MILKEGEHFFGDEHASSDRYIVEQFSKKVPKSEIEKNLARGARIEDRGDDKWTVVIPTNETYEKLIQEQGGRKR